MAYLLTKVCLVLLISTLALAQSRSASPDASWSDYSVKACCPTGYNEVGNYCVKCTAPLFFDPIDNRCNSCPEGHSFNSVTSRCECTVPCAAPRQINPATNQCECAVDQKGTRRVFSTNGNTCECPANLPLWNGRYCVVCPTGTEYDSDERQCYHCPEGFVRDYSSHACVPGL